jgi:P27 family predicted phage terminase small subunit
MPNDYPDKRREATVPGRDHGDVLARGVMKAPRWIDKEAKRIFRELSAELNNAGVLRRIDGDTLGEYCQARSDVTRIMREIVADGGEILTAPPKEIRDRHGNLSVIPGGLFFNPRVGVLRDARKRVKEFGDRLGLSPKSRTHMRFPAGASVGVDETDQLELFLREQDFQQGRSWNKADEITPGGNAEVQS